jgi:hypothetical protein
MLQETTDRQALKAAYRSASRSARGATVAELAELDHLAGEGVD